MAVLDRPLWAAGQIDALKELGVEVRQGQICRLVDETRGIVKLMNTEQRFDAIVAADGSSSSFRKSLKIPTANELVAWQVDVSLDDPKGQTLDDFGPTVWFDRHGFGTGYAWSFPAPGCVRLGFGASTSHSELGSGASTQQWSSRGLNRGPGLRFAYPGQL